LAPLHLLVKENLVGWRRFVTKRMIVHVLSDSLLLPMNVSAYVETC